jgi:hypothetical protein
MLKYRLKARKFRKFIILAVSTLLLLAIAVYASQIERVREAKLTDVPAVVSGKLNKWHKVTLTFTGLDTAEKANPNPFRDYRLNVTFTHGNKSYTVPGYYAADSNAAETSVDRGDKWQVNFLPDKVGKWNYQVSFRQGNWVAIADKPDAGKATAFDGITGSFTVTTSDTTESGFGSQGLLRYVDRHYLQFAETGKYFLKGGANSPENFLAYYEFDDTPAKHKYEPHSQDWRLGDPTWKGNKGKNIIGALNYLAGKGMNVVYFLTMNVRGDGDDVWPWISKNSRDRFDCSKLAQWEIVFSHMDRLGLMLHVVTQEIENDKLLDGGELGKYRQLYYRELIARFAHHPALIWNLGEENTNTHQQRQAFATYFRQHDPYNHPIFVHTNIDERDLVYKPLLGFNNFEGASLQLKSMNETHAETLKWRDRSAKTNRPWIVNLDEFGPAQAGVESDKDDPDRDKIRQEALWGNLMAGGGGVEWYFGYYSPDNDLTSEDWRSRDRIWDLTRYALEFFHNYLPFWEMSPDDSLISDANAHVLAKVGEVYAIYLKKGHSTKLQIPVGNYKVAWYDPRQGGQLQQGSVTSIAGDGFKSIGNPPKDEDRDWAVLVRRDRKSINN